MQDGSHRQRTSSIKGRIRGTGQPGGCERSARIAPADPPADLGVPRRPGSVSRSAARGCAGQRIRLQSLMASDRWGACSIREKTAQALAAKIGEVLLALAKRRQLQRKRMKRTADLTDEPVRPSAPVTVGGGDDARSTATSFFAPRREALALSTAAARLIDRGSSPISSKKNVRRRLPRKPLGPLVGP